MHPCLPAIHSNTAVAYLIRCESSHLMAGRPRVDFRSEMVDDGSYVHQTGDQPICRVLVHPAFFNMPHGCDTLDEIITRVLTSASVLTKGVKVFKDVVHSYKLIVQFIINIWVRKEGVSICDEQIKHNGNLCRKTFHLYIH